MDIDGIVDMITVTSRFAGLYTNAPHDGREGVIPKDGLKGFKIISGLHEITRPGCFHLRGKRAVAGGIKSTYTGRFDRI